MHEKCLQLNHLLDSPHHRPGKYMNMGLKVCACVIKLQGPGRYGMGFMTGKYKLDLSSSKL